MDTKQTEEVLKKIKDLIYQNSDEVEFGEGLWELRIDGEMYDCLIEELREYLLTIKL